MSPGFRFGGSRPPLRCQLTAVPFQTRCSEPGKDFESVELEAEVQQQREKVPRRIIHFSSGETMEEYSTDEEEEEEDKVAERKDLLSSPAEAVRVRTAEDVVGGG